MEWLESSAEQTEEQIVQEVLLAENKVWQDLAARLKRVEVPANNNIVTMPLPAPAGSK